MYNHEVPILKRGVRDLTPWWQSKDDLRRFSNSQVKPHVQIWIAIAFYPSLYPNIANASFSVGSRLESFCLLDCSRSNAFAVQNPAFDKWWSLSHLQDGESVNWCQVGLCFDWIMIGNLLLLDQAAQPSPWLSSTIPKSASPSTSSMTPSPMPFQSHQNWAQPLELVESFTLSTQPSTRRDFLWQPFPARSLKRRRSIGSLTLFPRKSLLASTMALKLTAFECLATMSSSWKSLRLLLSEEGCLTCLSWRLTLLGTVLWTTLGSLVPAFRQRYILFRSETLEWLENLIRYRTRPVKYNGILLFNTPFLGPLWRRVWDSRLNWHLIWTARNVKINNSHVAIRQWRARPCWNQRRRCLYIDGLWQSKE